MPPLGRASFKSSIQMQLQAVDHRASSPLRTASNPFSFLRVSSGKNSRARNSPRRSSNFPTGRNVCRACIQTTTMTVLLWIPILDGVKGTTSPLSHSSSLLFCFSRPHLCIGSSRSTAKLRHGHDSISRIRSVQTGQTSSTYTPDLSGERIHASRRPRSVHRIELIPIRTTAITRLKYDSSTILVTSLLISLHVPLIGPLLGLVQTLYSLPWFVVFKLHFHFSLLFTKCGIRYVN